MAILSDADDLSVRTRNSSAPGTAQMAALLPFEWEEIFQRADSIDLSVDSRRVSMAAMMSDGAMADRSRASLLDESTRQERLRNKLAVD